ncbi:MAG: hypothetical protein ACRESE_08870 [Gammaproteobacteria bacterium]
MTISGILERLDTAQVGLLGSATLAGTFLVAVAVQAVPAEFPGGVVTKRIARFGPRPATAVPRLSAQVAVFLLPLVQERIGVAWLMLVFAVIGIAGALLAMWLGEETAQKPLVQKAVAALAPGPDKQVTG